MKQCCIFLATFFVLINTQGQSLKKYPVSTSGCSAYLFCDPGNFERSWSDDSSIVYTAACKASDSISYGIICVQLKEEVADIELAEKLVISYLDFLKEAFNIRSAAGYGKGNMLNGNSNTRGVIDYWKDANGDEWKVKAWTNGKYLAVLYVYASGALNETTKTNVFLNGFRFPGM